MLAVETEELTKDYQVGFWRSRPFRALDRLNLQVGVGETFGFLGPNGAGKSTAIKLLMQLIYPTGGAARILGRPVGDASVKRRLGFLPENPSFYDHLTAEELLDYFARLFGMGSPGRAARVSRVLDDVGIGRERRMRLRSYSKGMIQRVGIAQAILNDPEIVFLDEPMSGLDPLGRRDVRALMLSLRNRGCTVFFSSHILADAEALCSQVAVVAQGALVGGGRLADILAFERTGWDVVVDGVSDAGLAALRGHATRVVRVADGRYSAELPPENPEKVIRALADAGARVMSLNPIRDSLEAYFVRQVASADARDTSRL